MGPKEALGRYGCVPLDPHPDWVSKLSFHARLIGERLIALCKDYGDLRLEVGEDWRESLCALLMVAGPDRRNAKVAMQTLADKGFLTVDSCAVAIHLVPVRKRLEASTSEAKSAIVPHESGSTSDPLRIHLGSTPDPDSTQVRGNTEVENRSLLINLEKSARAHTRGEGIPLGIGEGIGESSGAVSHFRAPVGEAPPNTEHAELDTHCVVKRLYSERYQQRRPGMAVPERTEASEGLAEWCDAHAKPYGCTPAQLAKRTLDGFFADPKAAAKRWPWGYLRQDPEEYAGDPPGVATVPKPPAKATAQAEQPPMPAWGRVLSWAQ